MDNVAISKKTLPDLIRQYKNSAQAAYNYYQALTSPDTHVIKHNFGGLGNIELHILIQRGLHRRVFMGRSNGMKIFDQKNFPAAIEFSGVCILKDESINSYFREMENPQHDAWEPERHSKPTDAKKRKQELYRYIKDTILEYGRKTTVAEIDAEGVGEYLPDDIDAGAGPDKKESIVDETKSFDLNLSTYKPVQSIPEMLFSEEGIQEDDGLGEPDEKGFGDSGSKDFGDGKSNQSGDGTNFGGADGDAPGKNGIGPYSYDKGVETPDSTRNVRRKFEIHTLSVRLIQIDANSHRYRLLFTPRRTAGEGYLQFKLSGEQSTIDVNISRAVDCVTSKPLQAKQNIIYLTGITKNVKMSVEFNVDYAEQSSMEVCLYGYKV